VTSRADSRYKWKVLACVVFGIFMVILDTTVVNVAFPTMRSVFHASLSDSQWIVSLYVLALGISTPMSGYLGDRFGSKRIYLLGLGMFVIGSIGSGLAPSLGVLIATRAIQGAGGGIALPLGVGYLFQTFAPSEQGTALGLYGIALLIAPALGPILGGLLVDHGMWRWIFFINVPVGIVGVLMGRALLKDTKGRASARLDPWGLLLSTIGFGATLYGASIASRAGWTSPPVLVALGAGVVALCAFVLVELFVADDPLLDFRLYRNPVFLNASVTGYVSVVALFGAEFLLPIYLQVLRGRTALQTGVILLPLAVAAGIITPIAGRLYDKIGPRALVAFGFGVLCLNTWQLSQLQADTSMQWIMILMALRGLALGATVQSTYTTALGTVQRSRVSRGSSMVNSTRYVVQSLAVAVLATALSAAQSPATQRLQQQAPRATATASSGRQPPPVAVCMPTGQSTSAATHRPVPVGERASMARACRETLHGFADAYWITFYAAACALCLGVLLPGWPFGWAGRSRAGRATGAA
jgi:DHA2 family multidrug resistance protein